MILDFPVSVHIPPSPPLPFTHTTVIVLTAYLQTRDRVVLVPLVLPSAGPPCTQAS